VRRAGDPVGTSDALTRGRRASHGARLGDDETSLGLGRGGRTIPGLYCGVLGAGIKWVAFRVYAPLPLPLPLPPHHLRPRPLPPPPRLANVPGSP
jgi:hypothetical protein